MAFDAMAAAVDWLDAYRSGDIETLLGMYAENAVTECGCDAVTIVGKNGLKAYWERCLQNYPASELDDLEPLEDGVTVRYVTADRHMAATLKFDSVGKIVVLKCGPAKLLKAPPVSAGRRGWSLGQRGAAFLQGIAGRFVGAPSLFFCRRFVRYPD